MAKFEKGRSGNPGGRPKMPAEMKQLAQSLTVEAIETAAEIMRATDAKRSDRLAACVFLRDTGYGRPAQAIEHSGEIGLAKDASDLSDDELAAIVASYSGGRAADATAGKGKPRRVH